MTATRAEARPGDWGRDIYQGERRFENNGSSVWQNAVTLAPEGFADCADVAIQCPVAWVGIVGWRVLLRIGSVIHQSGAGLIPAGLMALGGEVSGIIHRVRGTPHDGVLVETFTTPLAVPAGVATCHVKSWARSPYPFDTLLDADGNLVVEAVGAPAKLDAPGGALSSRLVSAVPCLLAGQQCYNPSGSDVWILAWDAAAVPAAGASSDLVPWRVPSLTQGSRSFPNIELATGFAWAVSSAADPYTVPAPLTPAWVDSHYLTP